MTCKVASFASSIANAWPNDSFLALPSKYFTKASVSILSFTNKALPAFKFLIFKLSLDCFLVCLSTTFVVRSLNLLLITSCESLDHILFLFFPSQAL